MKTHKPICVAVRKEAGQGKTKEKNLALQVWKKGKRVIQQYLVEREKGCEPLILGFLCRSVQFKAVYSRMVARKLSRLPCSKEECQVKLKQF